MSTTIPTAQPTSHPEPELAGGLEGLRDRYDTLLCDIWGVLHDGVRSFEAAGHALSRFRAAGGTVVLISNAPRPGVAVAAQLDTLGVPRGAYDDIRTSGDLTQGLIASRGDRPFHHIGPERDLTLFHGMPGRSGHLDDADYVLCTGLDDDETETVAHYRDRLAAMRARDLEMICANPDLVVERGHRTVLCAGALAAAYDDLGGRTVTAGKPHRPIYDETLRVATEIRGEPLDLRRVLGIGDAIRTDVVGGRAAGIDTLLVARGIHAAELGHRTGERLDPARVRVWSAQQETAPTLVTGELVWSD